MMRMIQLTKLSIHIVICGVDLRWREMHSKCDASKVLTDKNDLEMVLKWNMKICVLELQI